MPPTRSTVICLAALAALFRGAPVEAQISDTLAPPRPAVAREAGSWAEQTRLSHLLEGASTAGYLIRSTSSVLAAGSPARGGLRWSPIAPEADLAWNSDSPFSLNDGALWAGRGMNLELTAGIRAQAGRVSVLLAPTIAYSENRSFPLLPDSMRSLHPDRSDYSSPWFGIPYLRRVDWGTIDEPVRFGGRPYALIDPGQSSISVDLGRLVAGAGTESQWWGPGVQNALVMSTHAAGIPHLFLRTAAPVHTRIGDFEGKWLVGGLSESLFFDTVSTNGTRSLSALVVTLRPSAEPDLTLGVARSVYAPATGAGDVLASGLDVLTRWDRRASVTDTLWTPRTDQLTSLFARWVFPRSGFEAYAEWARQELPLSLRDLIVMPEHTQGYTLGTQWATPVRAQLVLRVQAEATFLEKSATFRHRPSNAFYTSAATSQGYTQRGQVIGAAIGPGSSSQWLAVDISAPRSMLGLYLNRIRWEPEGLYNTRSPIAARDSRGFHARDVSVVVGLRGSVVRRGVRLGADYAYETRFNFLFQNPDLGYSPAGAVDIRNHQLRLTVTPMWGLRLPSL